MKVEMKMIVAVVHLKAVGLWDSNFESEIEIELIDYLLAGCLLLCCMSLEVVGLWGLNF